MPFLITAFLLLTIAAMLSKTAHRMIQVFILAPIMGLISGGMIWFFVALIDNDLITLYAFCLAVLIATFVAEVVLTLTNIGE